ncbi:MAG TPA: pirin family protein [Chthoniobacterales bacterium]
MITLRKANERGHANLGWLDSWFSFSFADYYDPQWTGFRSLRALNDDMVLPGFGFGMHPHRNTEILTYVLSGSIEHKDSMGNGRIIRAGEVQYMSAGTGVRHSEFNPSRDEPARVLQIWIEPDVKNIKPSYAEQSFADAPKGRLSLVASKTGRDGSLTIHQDADLWLAKLDSDHVAEHRISPGRSVWLQAAEGSLEVNGITLTAGDAIIARDETVLKLTGHKSSQALLFDLN